MSHATLELNRSTGWLRRIAARNRPCPSLQTASANGVVDGRRIWLASSLGHNRAPANLHATTAPGTLWTWDAIGKRKGAGKLSDDATENRDGFLLNQMIDELLPANAGAHPHANADPRQLGHCSQVDAEGKTG